MPLLAKLEPLEGTINGANLRFTTPGNEPYVADSEVVFWRGIPRRRDWDDGWVQTDPDNGVITMREPPEEDDDLQMLYATSSETEVEVTALSGEIEADGDLAGSLETLVALTGAIEEPTQVAGTIEAQADLAGALHETDAIYGTLEVT